MFGAVAFILGNVQKWDKLSLISRKINSYGEEILLGINFSQHEGKDMQLKDRKVYLWGLECLKK